MGASVQLVTSDSMKKAKYLKTILADVMVGDRFYGSLTIIHDRIFGKLKDECNQALRERYPTIAHREDVTLHLCETKNKKPISFTM